MRATCRNFPFLLALLALGCAKGDFNAKAVSQGSTLTYPLTTKNRTLDPGKVNDSYGFELLQNVVEGLVFIDKDFRIQPWLAQSWDVKDGGRTYVFHIRKGVKYSNGRELVAGDFKWNWERVLAPSFGFPDATMYFSAIQGAMDYAGGKAKSISGVAVLDDHTLQVRLTAPRWYFIYYMTGVQTGVLAREAAGDKEAKRPEQIVGTGPYRIARFTPDQEVVLEANRDYWHGRPKVDRIVRPIITDAATRLSKFQTGELDYVELSQNEVSGLAQNPKLKACAHTHEMMAASYVSFGQKAYPPFRDVRVRRAFAMAVDRPHLVHDLQPGQREAKGFVPPNVPDYRPGDPGLPFDPAAARRELAAAGYPGGKGLPPVEFVCTPEPDSRLTAEAVVSDLRKNLGVDARIRTMEWTALWDRSNKGELALSNTGWLGSCPQDFLSEQFTTKGTYNKQGFHDAQIDALCAKADVEQDPKKRLALYKRADRRAVELAARLPLVFATRTYLLSPRATRFPTNATGPMPMFDAEVEG